MSDCALKNGDKSVESLYDLMCIEDDELMTVGWISVALIEFALILWLIRLARLKEQKLTIL